MSPGQKQLEEIIVKLEDVLTTAEKLTLTYADDLDKIHPAYKLSAQNLILYLAFRQLDFDRIKETLESFGISQLTKDERHIKSSIEAVINNIRKILFPKSDFQNITKEKFREGYNFQKINTTSLLGPEIADRITRIMVTLPSDAVYDLSLIHI